MESQQENNEEVYIKLNRYNSTNNYKVYFKSVNISQEHKKVLDIFEKTLKEFEELEIKLKSVSDEVKKNCDITQSFSDNFYNDLQVRHRFLEFLDTILRSNLYLSGDLTNNGKICWEFVVEEIMSKSIKMYDFSEYTSSQELSIKNFC